MTRAWPGAAALLLVCACPRGTASAGELQVSAPPPPAIADAAPALDRARISALRKQVPSAVDMVHPLSDEQVPLFATGDHFFPLPEPRPGEWLAEHPEPGQTFAQYVRAEPNRPSPPHTIIYLLPLGALRSEVVPEMEVIARFVGAYFGLETRTLPPLWLGPLKVKQRKNIYTGKRQLLAPALLDQLKPRLPEDAYCLIGLTGEDLYPHETWNFVFGQATLRERVGVFSFARYDPAFYDPAPLNTRRSEMLRRSLKVVTHEIGHMFGMHHCTHFRCLMNGVNHMDEADATPAHLCPICLRKLGWVTGTDLVARYRALAAIYRELGMTDEAAWVQDRLVVVGF